MQSPHEHAHQQNDEQSVGTKQGIEHQGQHHGHYQSHHAGHQSPAPEHGHASGEGDGGHEEIAAQSHKVNPVAQIHVGYQQDSHGNQRYNAPFIGDAERALGEP